MTTNYLYIPGKTGVVVTLLYYVGSPSVIIWRGLMAALLERGRATAFIELLTSDDNGPVPNFTQMAEFFFLRFMRRLKHEDENQLRLPAVNYFPRG